jgi:hypothetical protein
MLDFPSTELVDATMKFHSFATVFPLMPQLEIESLAADIAKNGLHFPIVVDEAGIGLDGRNRLLACLWSGTAIRTETFIGTEEEKRAFILSGNLHRRHLNESQRAMVAARAATLSPGRPNTAIAAIKQVQAAEQCRVSVDSLQRARKVLAYGTPALITAVDSGVMKVAAAAGIVHLPPERQVARIERDRLKSIGESRQKDDWYRTGASLTEKLLTKERFGRRIWESMRGRRLDLCRSQSS